MGEKETATAEEFERAAQAPADAPAQASNLNSSKSDVARGGSDTATALAGDDPVPGGSPPAPQRATNLNSSKSNTYRAGRPAGDPGGGGGGGARAMASICGCGNCMQDAYGRCSGCDSTGCDSAEDCGCGPSTL